MGEASKWTKEELAAYLAALGLAAEGVVQVFLEDVLAALPLPSPWVIVRGEDGHLVFGNPNTQEATWRHPLDHVLPELAKVCQTVMGMSSEERSAQIFAQDASWRTEVARVSSSWSEATDNEGKPYFYNQQTGDTSWQNPQEAIIPAFTVKLEAIARLLDEDYIQRLRHNSAEGKGQASEAAVSAGMAGRMMSHLSSALSKRRNAVFDFASGPTTSDEHIESWTPEECAAYVASLGLTSSAEGAVQRFLEDALGTSELPKTWITARDERGRLYFANTFTRKASWHHPLESELAVLAEECRTILQLPEVEREGRVRAQHAAWIAEFEASCASWVCTKDENDYQVYYNSTTGEMVFEDPSEVALPSYKMKLGALARLLDKDYVRRRLQPENCIEGGATSSSTRGRIMTRNPPSEQDTADSEAAVSSGRSRVPQPLKVMLSKMNPSRGGLKEGYALAPIAEAPADCAADTSSINRDDSSVAATSAQEASAHAAGTQEEWSQDDRAAYMGRLALVKLPDEAAILHFLEDALGLLPLPAPWILKRGSGGRLYFADSASGQSTWQHPLEHVLKELAIVARAFFVHSDGAAVIQAQHVEWTSEFQGKIGQWMCGADEHGQQFLLNPETQEWILDDTLHQEYKAKLEAIGRLVDESYVAHLRQVAEATKRSDFESTASRKPELQHEAEAAARQGPMITASTKPTSTKPKRVETAHPNWKQSECLGYVRSLQIAALGNDPATQAFLADAICHAPLPPPWTCGRSRDGRFFFHNKASRKSAWKHPLEEILLDLSTACKQCLHLAEPERQAHVRALQALWTADSQTAHSQWETTTDQDGRPCWRHCETGETVHVDPREASLLPFRAKSDALEKLLDADYVSSLGSCSSQHQAASPEPRQAAPSQSEVQTSATVQQTASESSKDQPNNFCEASIVEPAKSNPGPKVLAVNVPQRTNPVLEKRVGVHFGQLLDSPTNSSYYTSSPTNTISTIHTVSPAHRPNTGIDCKQRALETAVEQDATKQDHARKQGGPTPGSAGVTGNPASALSISQEQANRAQPNTEESPSFRGSPTAGLVKGQSPTTTHEEPAAPNLGNKSVIDTNQKKKDAVPKDPESRPDLKSFLEAPNHLKAFAKQLGLFNGSSIENAIDAVLLKALKPALVLELPIPWEVQRCSEGLLFLHLGCDPPVMSREHPLHALHADILTVLRKALSNTGRFSGKLVFPGLARLVWRFAGREGLAGFGSWQIMKQPLLPGKAFFCERETGRRRSDDPRVAAESQVGLCLTGLKAVWDHLAAVDEAADKFPVTTDEVWRMAKEMSLVVMAQPSSQPASRPPAHPGDSASDGLNVSTNTSKAPKSAVPSPTDIVSLSESLAASTASTVLPIEGQSITSTASSQAGPLYPSIQHTAAPALTPVLPQAPATQPTAAPPTAAMQTISTPLVLTHVLTTPCTKAPATIPSPVAATVAPATAPVIAPVTTPATTPATASATAPAPQTAPVAVHAAASATAPSPPAPAPPALALPAPAPAPPAPSLPAPAPPALAPPAPAPPAPAPSPPAPAPPALAPPAPAAPTPSPSAPAPAALVPSAPAPPGPAPPAPAPAALTLAVAASLAAPATATSKAIATAAATAPVVTLPITANTTAPVKIVTTTSETAKKPPTLTIWQTNKKAFLPLPAFPIAPIPKVLSRPAAHAVTSPEHVASSFHSDAVQMSSNSVDAVTDTLIARDLVTAAASAAATAATSADARLSRLERELQRIAEAETQQRADNARLREELLEEVAEAKKRCSPDNLSASKDESQEEAIILKSALEPSNITEMNTPEGAGLKDCSISALWAEPGEPHSKLGDTISWSPRESVASFTADRQTHQDQQDDWNLEWTALQVEASISQLCDKNEEEQEKEEMQEQCRRNAADREKWESEHNALRAEVRELIEARESAAVSEASDEARLHEEWQAQRSTMCSEIHQVMEAQRVRTLKAQQQEEAEEEVRCLRDAQHQEWKSECGALQAEMRRIVENQQAEMHRLAEAQAEAAAALEKSRKEQQEEDCIRQRNSAERAQWESEQAVLRAEVRELLNTSNRASRAASESVEEENRSIDVPVQRNAINREGRTTSQEAKCSVEPMRAPSKDSCAAAHEEEWSTGQPSMQHEMLQPGRGLAGGRDKWIAERKALHDGIRQVLEVHQASINEAQRRDQEEQARRLHRSDECASEWQKEWNDLTAGLRQLVEAKQLSVFKSQQREEGEQEWQAEQASLQSEIRRAITAQQCWIAEVHRREEITEKEYRRQAARRTEEFQEERKVLEKELCQFMEAQTAGYAEVRLFEAAQEGERRGRDAYLEAEWRAEQHELQMEMRQVLEAHKSHHAHIRRQGEVWEAERRMHSARQYEEQCAELRALQVEARALLEDAGSPCLANTGTCIGTMQSPVSSSMPQLMRQRDNVQMNSDCADIPFVSWAACRQQSGTDLQQKRYDNAMQHYSEYPSKMINGITKQQRPASATQVELARREAACRRAVSVPLKGPTPRALPETVLSHGTGSEEGSQGIRHRLQRPGSAPLATRKMNEPRTGIAGSAAELYGMHGSAIHRGETGAPQSDRAATRRKTPNQSLTPLQELPSLRTTTRNPQSTSKSEALRAANRAHTAIAGASPQGGAYGLIHALRRGASAPMLDVRSRPPSAKSEELFGTSVPSGSPSSAGNACFNNGANDPAISRQTRRTPPKLLEDLDVEEDEDSGAHASDESKAHRMRVEENVAAEVTRSIIKQQQEFEEAHADMEKAIQNSIGELLSAAYSQQPRTGKSSRPSSAKSFSWGDLEAEVCRGLESQRLEALEAQKTISEAVQGQVAEKLAPLAQRVEGARKRYLEQNASARAGRQRAQQQVEQEAVCAQQAEVWSQALQRRAAEAVQSQTAEAHAAIRAQAADSARFRKDSNELASYGSSPVESSRSIPGQPPSGCSRVQGSLYGSLAAANGTTAIVDKEAPTASGSASASTSARGPIWTAGMDSTATTGSRSRPQSANHKKRIPACLGRDAYT